MKVFVDFENTLLQNSIFWEKFWAYTKKSSFNIFGTVYALIKGKLDCNIENIPYNTRVLNTIAFNHNRYNDEIIFIYSCKENRVYVEQAITELSEEFESRFSLAFCEPAEKRKFILHKMEDSPFSLITASLSDWKLMDDAEKFFIIGNAFYCLIANYKSTNNSSYNTYFNGFFGIPFSYIEIMYPILCSFPAWFEKDKLNFPGIRIFMISSIFFLSFFTLLRHLEELQSERKFLKDGYTLSCSSPFILGAASIKLGIFYLLVFFALGVSCFFFSFSGALSGLILGWIFREIFFFKFWIRISIMTIAIAVIQIFLNFKNFYV